MAVGVALALAGGGCVLGVDTSRIDPADARDADAPDAAGIDETTDAPDAAADDLCAADAPAVCTADGAGILACVDGAPSLSLCPFGCLDGVCRPRCAASSGCSDDFGATIVCDAAQRVVDQTPCPDGFSCVLGGCRAATRCDPGRACDGSDVVVCAPNGAWEVAHACQQPCASVWTDRDEDGWGDGTVAVDARCGEHAAGFVDNPFDCDDSVGSTGDTPCDGWALVRPGTFTMGTSEGEANPIPDTEAAHLVEITRPFLIMQHEVTQALWDTASGAAANPSANGGCPTCPVERVNWFEVLLLANRLSAQLGLPACYTLGECTGTFGGGCLEGEASCNDGYRCDRAQLADETCAGVRLPTEAEWEYATRAGTTGPFSGVLDARAWYRRTAADTTPRPVATLGANAWGLYDVHGNVAEWTADLFAPYGGALNVAMVDPLVWGAAADVTALTSRVTRGGSVASLEDGCRSAKRAPLQPTARVATVGVRFVRAVPMP